MTNPATEPPPTDPADEALAEYLALLEAGERPVPAAFLADRPYLPADLAPLLDEVARLHDAGRAVAAAAGPVAPISPPHAPALLGEFELVRELGRGGMGVVYEAVQRPLGRPVAVKVLRAGASADPHERRRFLREARAASRLTHPHIVPVYAVGEADGVAYYAMYRVDGASLAAVLRARRRAAGLVDGGPPDSSDAILAADAANPGPRPGDPSLPRGAALGTASAVQLAVQAADALAAAHAAGLVHRDVKPGNLLLDVHGRVWLTDFGLARQTGATDSTGAAAGTLRYMAPEQTAGRADARSDVYGLAATLYELLTLRPAVPGDAPSELLHRLLYADPAPVARLNPAVPADLATVVHKGLARDPADRYPSAAAFADDLRRVLAGEPVAARPLTRLQRGQRWAGRRRRPLLAAGTALAVGLVFGLAAAGQQWAARAAARREADARRAALRALVAELEPTVGRLKHLPNGEAVHRTQLRTLADARYQLAADPAADPADRAAAAEALFELYAVDFAHTNGRPDPQTVERMTAVAERMMADAPADPVARRALARARLYAPDPGAGRAARLEAIALFEGLEADFPMRGALYNPLDDSYQTEAGWHTERGDHATALGWAERGLTLARRMAARWPTGHPWSYIRLALSHARVAECRTQLGDLDGAEAAFREAVAADAVLARDFPVPPAYREHSCTVRIRYGRFLAARSRPDDADRELRSVADLCRRLVADQPGVGIHQERLTALHLAAAQTAFLAGRPNAPAWAARGRADVPLANPSTRAWVALAVPGVPDPPTAAEVERLLGPDTSPAARAHLVGAAHLRGGDPAAAEPLFAAAAVAGHVAAPYYRAVCLARLGRRAEAAAAVRAADASGTLDRQALPDARVARTEAVRELGE